MNKIILPTIFLILGIIFSAYIIIGVSTVYADEHEVNPIITIFFDNQNYSTGDTIVVSGQVTTIIGSTPVTLQLFTEGNLVEIVQITVAQDGTYSHTIIAEGPLWNNQGEYTGHVSYNNLTAESSFNFIPSTPSIMAQSEMHEIDETITIPSWIKIIAGSWHKGEISDATFLDAITSLIDKGIIELVNYQKIDSDISPQHHEDGEIIETFITVTTDRKSYNLGDEITISGTLSVSDETTVPFGIINALDNVMMTGNIPHNNSTYQGTFTLDNIGYVRSGEYEIQVVSGEIRNFTNFDLTMPLPPPSPITVTTDKSTYYTNDIITISGTVPIESTNGVTVLIVSPAGNIVTLSQLMPNNGEYQTIFLARSGTMNVSGEYQVRVQQGSDKLTITFDYEWDGKTPDPEPTPQPTPEPDPEVES